MVNIAKASVIILIIVLAVSSIMEITPVYADVAKLPTPEFTVTYTDHSYDVPATTTTDPYTGKTIEVPVKHVEDRTVQFTIKNQKVTLGQLHFIIQMKGYFSNNWTRIYDGWANSSEPQSVWAFSTFRGENIQGKEGWFYCGGQSFYLPAEGKTDFQVKAQTWGEVMLERTPQNPFGGSHTTMFGESEWSNTQTITIAEAATVAPTVEPSQSQPTQNPTITPSVQPSVGSEGLFGFSWERIAIAVMAVAIVLMAVGMVVLWRKVAAK